MKLQNDCYELEQTSSKCIKVEKFRKELFVLWYTNIDKVKIFCVIHNKVTLLTRRCSEWRTTNCHQRIFRKGLTIH